MEEMMLKHKRTIFVAVLIAFIISGCMTKSESEVLEEVTDIAEEIFLTYEMTEREHNINDDLAIYLPNRMSIEEIEENNVIINDGEQTFILFYNPFESPESDLNYEIAQQETSLLLETFEEDDKFGYIQVVDEDGEYRIQVSVGGIKMTTITTLGNMSKDAEDMMMISLSMLENDLFHF